MNAIQVTARCKIHDGQLDAFKARAEACVESVRAKDTGTLQYDWFFNADHTECVVREKYKDSNAVLEHIGNLGDLLGALMEVCDLSIEVFGNVSPELAEATKSFNAPVYSHFISK